MTGYCLVRLPVADPFPPSSRLRVDGSNEAHIGHRERRRLIPDLFSPPSSRLRWRPHPVLLVPRHIVCHLLPHVQVLVGHLLLLPKLLGREISVIAIVVAEW